MMRELGAAASGAPRLHHVALGTYDVAGLASFYCRLLEAEPARRHLDDHGALRSIWLDLSGTWLMIERAYAGQSRARVEGVGLGPFLLAFSGTAQQRREFEARASALGAAIESRSIYTSYLRDPDGNRVAMSEYEVGS